MRKTATGNADQPGAVRLVWLQDATGLTRVEGNNLGSKDLGQAFAAPAMDGAGSWEPPIGVLLNPLPHLAPAPVKAHGLQLGPPLRRELVLLQPHAAYPFAQLWVAGPLDRHPGMAKFGFKGQ